MTDSLTTSTNHRTPVNLSHLAELLDITAERLQEILLTADKQYQVYPLIKGRKKRWIEAPTSVLKQLQRRLLDAVLYRLTPDDAAHGFVPGRSIVTNARQHCGQDWVVTMDIRDFFPTIRAEIIFRQLAGLDMTEEAREQLVVLVTRNGRLPQGAPTSPHLANLVARRLDERLKQLAASSGWRYTRYADDLAFSGAGEPKKLILAVDQIVITEGFQSAHRKTQLMSRHQRQIVTGLVVNKKVALPRHKRRVLRAMLHQLRSTNTYPQLNLSMIHGHLALAAHIDPQGYRLTCRQISQILESSGQLPQETVESFALRRPK